MMGLRYVDVAIEGEVDCTDVDDYDVGVVFGVDCDDVEDMHMHNLRVC